MIWFRATKTNDYSQKWFDSSWRHHKDKIKSQKREEKKLCNDKNTTNKRRYQGLNGEYGSR